MLSLGGRFNQLRLLNEDFELIPDVNGGKLGHHISFLVLLVLGVLQIFLINNINQLSIITFTTVSGDSWCCPNSEGSQILPTPAGVGIFLLMRSS